MGDNRIGMDYITHCGERGDWHAELYDTTLAQIERACREEFASIDADLKRRTDKRLKELVIVELSESDVSRITGGPL